ncbi:MAG TPA: glycosyltransferase [Myxococcota bacterium]|nr:glycosyltransferase [Myxococcota bacterium]
MSDALATIVVVPRDHFGDMQESLESVLAHTDRPYELAVVDAGSPRATSEYLREAQARAGFRRIATSHPLTPNQARNLGLAEVRTRYVVFLDNDVVVTPGWLPPLVACAEETGASVVGPLIYEGRPLHTRIHFTGGEARVETRGDSGERHLVDRILKDEPPTRRRTGCAEFHGVLVRAADLLRLGGLDERLLSTRENLDFCMSISAAGGSIWLEPRSRITYLPPDPLRLPDVRYFALRWSDAWDRASFEHLRAKWGLVHDEYFEHQDRILGWRRRELLMEGCLLRWLPSTRLRVAAERALRSLERAVNDWWAHRETPRLGLC